jgi:hypothetical protein
MAVHKDCYSAIDLTQQDGPHRRETDGRIHVEKINGPFLFRDGGSPAECGAGMKVAIERGWLEMQRSGTVHAGRRRAGLMADTGWQRKSRIRYSRSLPPFPKGGRLHLIDLPIEKIIIA